MEGGEAGQTGSVLTVTSLSPPRTIIHRRRESARSIEAHSSDSRRSRTLDLRLWVLEGDFKAVMPIQRPANPIQPGAAMTSQPRFLVECDWL